MRTLWVLIEQSLSYAGIAEVLDLRGSFRRSFRVDPDAALAPLGARA